MELSKCFLRPGTVVEVVDRVGTVKATSPGLFSVDDDHELLPPIIPFTQSSGSSFSSPKVGDIIWILHDRSNSQLFMYIRYNRFDDVVSKILKEGEDEDIEVIFSRDTNKGLYQLYFSDGTGIKLLRDDSFICIKPNGDIDIVTENSKRSISLSGDSICLGADSENAPSVKNHVAYGEKVEECLNTINSVLKQLQKLATANPYTSPLSAAFATLPKLETQIPSITSNDVRVI